ncbi:hypothetical protein FB107DRAFT_210867 [Schizophyllum commune]
MALPGPHHRFLSRLRKLSESNIPPLPTRQMTAEFRRQTKAQLAALKKVLKADTIGRPEGGRPARRRARAKAPAPDPAADATADAAGSRARDAAARIHDILERPAVELDIAAVWRMTTDPPEPASREEAEDDAICRLLSGIELHSSKVWRDSSPADAIAVAAASYDQLNAYGDDGVLLVQLHNRIHTASIRHDLCTFRERIRLQADTIEFGFRWLALGPRRSVQKDEFFKNVYFSQHPADYVTQLDKEGIEHDPDFARWKETVMRPIVMGRNRLVLLYKKFGLPVLLDPFWTVKALQQNSRTRQFTDVFNQVLEIAHSRDYDQAAVAFLKGFDMRSVAERLFDVENEEEDVRFPIDSSDP